MQQMDLRRRRCCCNLYSYSMRGSLNLQVNGVLVVVDILLLATSPGCQNSMRLQGRRARRRQNLVALSEVVPRIGNGARLAVVEEAAAGNLSVFGRR